ncbi:MAG TPA: 4'-phosphopantetheinyl transferase superfamily protein [Streptosporangiaceae bacterium]|nr:4'-phosphopantetheinyl transferase superfamily protein [Streptosporangiaceae bacterium]
MRRSRSAPKRDRLAPGDVHAWLVDLDTPPDDWRRALGPEELARAGSYISVRDGARFGAGRAWLRVILGRYLRAEPADLQFQMAPRGRLTLIGEHAGSVHFSLSRSAERGLVTVSYSSVGADIELVTPRAELADLIAARFGAAEARCIAGGCGSAPLRGFYRHWTAKEAYLKATGRGLAGLPTTELVCGAHPAIRVGGHLANWTLSLLDPAPGCVAAVVGSGPVARCRTGSQ